ncbi:MAG: hypothetical protein UE295_03800 [Acutalibacteraceae bacterium]|nr:hypothetical protein [Acutalibacteraceae bacterium]
MPRRIAQTTLNASTIDILNVIRQNASQEYQSSVPVVETETDIPRVGEVIYGTPALANQFINALVNRIALVRVNSATFNNAYADLKKGYLEFGETVEEVFVAIAKARTFSVEKAPAREFRRTLPDVRSAFHIMNWRVQYPVTIQDEDLRMAFTSINGVQDLIAKIVDAVYTGAEYDEYLLFKYLLIKAIAHGKMKPVAVDTSDIHNSAIAYRGISNMLPFMKSDYNEAGVPTTTPKADQYIFIDAMYDARYDVGVLAGAFNMDKADFIGKRKLIDDWTTFDSARFEQILEESDQIEPITDAELALMQDVVGVIVDKEWFQIYDNLAKFTETYVGSGMYWNYFYNVWKTISHSPYSNAVVFVDDTATTTTPATLTFTVADKETSADATIFTLELTEPTTLGNTGYNFVQTETATENGVAIHRYGAIIVPSDAEAVGKLQAKIGEDVYETASAFALNTAQGATVTLTKV